MYQASSKTKVGLVEYIVSLCLFYQLGLLTELLFNMFVTYYYDFVNYNDLIMNMSNNNQNNNPGQNNSKSSLPLSLVKSSEYNFS